MKHPRLWGALAGAVLSVATILVGCDAAFAGLLVSSGVMYAGL